MGKSTTGRPTLGGIRKQEEKDQIAERSRLRKLYSIIAGVVVVIGITAFLVINSMVAAEAAKSHIPSEIPDTADTVVLTPSSKDWWGKVTSLATLDLELHDLDPYAADLKIKSLGYSRSADTQDRAVLLTGASRVVYIESETEDEAKAVEEWLKTTEGYPMRAVFRNGNVVKVTNNWVTEYESPEKAVSSRSDYSLGKVEDKAQMWINFDNQIDSISGVNNPQRNLVENYFRKSFALKTGTAWAGTSQDGVTWYGTYKSGGIDMKAFDPDVNDKELQGTKKELVPGSSDTFKVYDNKLYSLIMHSGFKNAETEKSYGAVQVGGGATVKNEKLAATIEPSQWNTAAMGLGASNEGTSKMTYSFSDTEMSLVIAYGAAGIAPEMPGFQTIDSPEVTILPIPAQ